MISPLGPPFARGRSADLFAIGDDLVLRRNRNHDVAPSEVAAMELAEAAGFPVPHIHRVTDRTLLLNRVAGDSMLDILGRRPWRAARYGRLLGDLALQLRAIAPDDRDLRTNEPNDTLVHGDLHPGNVLMSPDGPVVIDWESACAGPADSDAATTWLLTASADVDEVPTLIRPILSLIRTRFIEAFLQRTGRPRPETVDQVCEVRLADPNMRPAERVRIEEFRTCHGGSRRA